ncbi:hypothetical protein XacyCFBP2565_20675 [Xanthomonas arboricola pv. corylina]|nr:hypothetical protein XacyCFBP2565_20675 [Xanthomonas arboricola pv. corylina]
MPRKSLHGRTCGVSCDGGRARTLQPSGRTTRSTLDPCALSSHWEHNAQSNKASCNSFCQLLLKISLCRRYQGDAGTTVPASSRIHSACAHVPRRYLRAGPRRRPPCRR